MKILVHTEILPQHLQKQFDEDDVPLCASCIFGQAHKTPWSTKSKKSKQQVRYKTDDEPNAGTSTDQLVSSQPGLVAQASGRLTNLCVVGATIYIDHFTDWVYVHLMHSLSDKETLKSKQAYECKADSHSVYVKQYHSDNGRFGRNLCCEACTSQGQDINFCGVCAHHQNGI
eukprot:12997714-Ditylum_brightwellii.AAC.1